jgi:orotate phosphoribosyltransferase
MDFDLKFKELKVIQEGHFILSSGLRSRQYLQCARIFEDANFATSVCEVVVKKILQTFGEDAFDLVVSPAMGGLFVGYEVSRQLQIRNVFFERVNKVFELRRNFEIAQNLRILIVEDVVTTGKSTMEVFELLEPYKPSFVAQACVFDRRADEVKLPFELISFRKINIEAFDPNNLPADLQKIEPVKLGSRNL